MSGGDPGAGGLPPLGIGDGGYDRFRADLLDALADKRQLSRLRRGASADWVIALLEGWATMADVVAFYAERILNDAFLATVEQPAARNRLYRSLGHAFPANTAATTVLAYQVTSHGAGIEAVARAKRRGAGGSITPPPAPPPSPPSPSQIAATNPAAVFGVPRRDLIPGATSTTPAPGAAPPGARTTVLAGSQVRAIPDQGAPPPVFVTLGTLDARPGLSSLRPALAVSAGPPPLTAATTQVELAGTSTGLKVGNPIMIVADGGGDTGQATEWVRTLTAVTPDAERKSTRIGWNEPLSAPAPGEAPATLGPGTVYAFAASASLVGSDAQPWQSASPAARAAAFAGAPPQVQGGVLRSTDGGTSWRAAAALPPTVTELTAAAVVGEVLLVGAGGAGALVSVAGSPLVAASLPAGNHGITCAGGRRSRLLVGTSDGLVLQSADDGRSWSRVSGGPPTKDSTTNQVTPHQLPGSPVHAVLDPGQDDMLLAGTDTGLYLLHRPGWDPQPYASEAIFALLQVTPPIPVTPQTRSSRGGIRGRRRQGPESADGQQRRGPQRHRDADRNPRVRAGDDRGVALAHRVRGNGRRRAASGRCDAPDWRPINGSGAGALPAGMPVTALAAAPGLLLAVTPAGLYRSEDDGQVWQRCTTAELFTIPAAAVGAVTGGAVPPPGLLAAFSARGIEFAAGARLTAVGDGLELADRRGVTYLLTGGAIGGWSVALADGLPGVTAVTAGVGGLIACVSPITPLADEWPGFLVVGNQLEVSGTVRAAVPGGSGAIVQQTATPHSQVLDITAVEQDAGQRFGQAARMTRLTVEQDLPVGAFPRRTSTVWVGAAPLEPYIPPPAAVTPVSGTRIPLERAARRAAPCRPSGIGHRQAAAGGGRAARRSAPYHPLRRRRPRARPGRRPGPVHDGRRRRGHRYGRGRVRPGPPGSPAGPRRPGVAGRKGLRRRLSGPRRRAGGDLPRCAPACRGGGRLDGRRLDGQRPRRAADHRADRGVWPRRGDDGGCCRVPDHRAGRRAAGMVGAARRFRRPRQSCCSSATARTRPPPATSWCWGPTEPGSRPGQAVRQG